MQEVEKNRRAVIAALVDSLNEGGPAAAAHLVTPSATFTVHPIDGTSEPFRSSSMHAAIEQAYKPIPVMPGDRRHITVNRVTMLEETVFLVEGGRTVLHTGGADGRPVAWLVRFVELLLDEIDTFGSADEAMAHFTGIPHVDG